MHQVLVIGGGGREHALAWKLARSPRVETVLVAPGNAGTAGEPGVSNAAVAADDIDGLVALAQARSIDVTVVGPEAPLALGVVDRFRAAGLACFGPSAAAAQLEASKAFAKDFLARHAIPTADYGVFAQVDDALAYIRHRNGPLVVKADGLAAGKGVVLAPDRPAAEAAVQDMLEGQRFGAAGRRVVVEEFLLGEEASFIALADGEHLLPLASSQDHKAALDGDLGPNTGGMGAYSPAPVVTPAVERRILDEVMMPAVSGMAAEGRPFTGFLYAGVMIAPDGAPKVLEFNVRLGDPETQPLLMRLDSDLFELLEAALAGGLDRIDAHWNPRSALGVVLAAEGYPGEYRKGDVISGLWDAANNDVRVFHAGTAQANGQVITAGGRVL
ncbi:MAG: phosphoribosylamine--glycine ligase, partial [Salinisphaera sp.]|nr:phosphoribosylamine--glycine ligase [Salinisphaera sp.]